MALNTSVGTNPVTLVLSLGIWSAGATDAAVFNRRIRSFTTDQRLTAISTGAATLYGVNHPGRINQPQRVFRFRGDGVTVSFTLATAPTGVTYPTTADAALTEANYLQAIALVLPEERGMEVDSTLLIRRGNVTAPGAGEWHINGTAVVVGTAPTAGQFLEVIIPDPTKIVQHNGGALTASRKIVFKATDFLVAGVAAVNIEPAKR